jgi:two-component system response regulator AtoC
MRHILVVEQDEGLRQAVQLALREAGYEATGVPSVEAALRALQAAGAATFAAVVAPADPALLAAARRRRPPAAVIAVVASDDARAGLEAIRRGAEDFVRRAVDPELLLAAVHKAEARAAQEIAVAGGEPRVRADDPVPELVGASAPMGALRASLLKVAPHKTTVLVRGESGTGKEVVARALHRLSPRAAGPFVAVNCGAIPAGLLESELFGHRKGAFTDAVRDRTGLVEQASGGTLFLDEIGELEPALQVKLLRVLEDGRVRRLGDDAAADVAVDVRLVTATARPLEAAVAAGRFRADLLYRLDVVTLHLPPLRERGGDVPALAEHFLGRARARLGVAVGGFGPEALRLLSAYRWPGNVRELENVIEHAAVLCEGGEIDAASLPERLRGNRTPDRPAELATPATAASGDGDLSIKRAAREAEESLIRKALARTGGNRTRAAELLEISHRALLYKIKEYGI